MTPMQVSRRTFLTGAGTVAVGFSLAEPAVRALAPLAAGAAEPSALYSIRDSRGANPPPLSWLIVGAESIEIHCGKVELGTGIETAFTQIVLEELHLRFEHVKYVQGDTAITPNDGVTAGSKSLQNGGPLLRAAAATAFAALAEEAASRLRVPVGDLVAEPRAFRVGRRKRITWAELLEGRPDRLIPSQGSIALKNPDDHTVVGRSIPRVDLPAKVFGTFQYLQNVRVDGMVHGRVIRPAGRNARDPVITEVARAQRIPGFLAVVRHADFVGVVAETEWAAIQAANRGTGIVVNWTQGPPLVSQASLPGALRDASSANLSGGGTEALTGDPDAAFADPEATVLTALYDTPYQMHGSMGPSCGIADVRPTADADGYKAVIWAGSQNVGSLRQACARLLGLSDAEVRVIYAEAAGCYGHNGADDAPADAALLSRAVGLPVRVQWSRQDEHGWEPLTPPMAHDMRGSVKGGRITGWEHVAWTPTHNARPGNSAGGVTAGQLTGSLPASLPASGGGTATRNGPVTYDVGSQRMLSKVLKSFVTSGNRAPAAPLTWRYMRSSALRSLGGLSDSFANESFFDELAHAGGLDPLEARIAHHSDPRAVAVLEALRRTWSSRPAGGAGRGAGVSYQQYENENAYVAAYAEVTVDRSNGAVKVDRAVVAHDCGQIVNPDGLINQIEGCVIQGVSRTLIEEVHYNANGVTSTVWQLNPPFQTTPQYEVIRFTDVPEIETILIDRPHERSLGAGEPAIGAIPGAVGNAIFAATGARLRSLPMTPAKVKAALDALA